jgi:hypothetical protein
MESENNVVGLITTPIVNGTASPTPLKAFVVSPAAQRTQQLFWRDVRSHCRNCKTFADLLNVVSKVDIKPPPCPEPGPARSAWMAESQNDQRIRTSISLIASTTRIVVGAMVDITSLEATLWVFVHLGSQTTHAMNLIADTASAQFNMVVGDMKQQQGRGMHATSEAQQWRSDILEKCQEIGSLIKPHTVELAKYSSILPDDVRNFVQRWIMIKVRKACVLVLVRNTDHFYSIFI